MPDNQKQDAKQRIFDAAVYLFARKGYAAVGIREIAKRADVQISMVNYYYDGKISILKAIMDDCYSKYAHAIQDIGDEQTPLDDRVQMLVHNLVMFYKNNMDLAIAAFGAIPVDIPEIIDYRIKWFESTRATANAWFQYLGLDSDNAALMSVLRDFLNNTISNFFKARYCCNRVEEEEHLSEHVKEHFKHDDHAVELDDAFFDDYVNILSQMYLYGITSIIKNKNQPTKKGG